MSWLDIFVLLLLNLVMFLYLLERRRSKRLSAVLWETAAYAMKIRSVCLYGDPAEMTPGSPEPVTNGQKTALAHIRKFQVTGKRHHEP